MVTGTHQPTLGGGGEAESESESDPESDPESESGSDLS
jgi:hypothetical protein